LCRVLSLNQLLKENARGAFAPQSQLRRPNQIIYTFAREAYIPMMRLNFVSIHPYFKVHPGKLETFKASLTAFVDKTAAEKKNLFYGFTINGNEVFCREGYTDAEGVLAHLENVGALLAEALKIADLTRVELHGPAEELDKLKGPLAHLNPAWFVVERERR
jgi:quinol monooxygenase YgiN